MSTGRLSIALCLVSASLVHAREIEGAAPSTQPASQPVESTSTKAEVDRLIKQLGSRRFKDREDAQRQLTLLGDGAASFLVPYVTSRDAEIAARVAAVIGTPRDPAVRVDLALRLIESTDPDWMERGVHMLFKSPGETADLFLARTESASGRNRAMFGPIREQFESWKRMERMFRASYERLKDKDPQRAEKLRESHEETALYCAEAAYWGAQDALLDVQEHPPPVQEAGELPTTAPSK